MIKNHFVVDGRVELPITRPESCGVPAIPIDLKKNCLSSQTGSENNNIFNF